MCECYRIAAPTLIHICFMYHHIKKPIKYVILMKTIVLSLMDIQCYILYFFPLTWMKQNIISD